jgi:uroporphyrin-3 C-methyltransferase
MTDQPKKSARSSVWISTGILFSSLAIIIFITGLAYTFFALSRVNTQLTQLSEALQKNASEQKNTSGLQDTVNTLQETLQKYAAQQEQLSSDLHAVQGNDQNKLHFVQAEALIKMANNQLQFSHNTHAAIQLLQQADQQLQSTSDPALLDVRKSIAADLANLKAASTVDVTSVFLRLYALNEVIDKLPLPLEPLKQEQQTDKETFSWKNGMHALMQGLNKIVIVKKNDASALPLILPDEKIFLYQNLHAQLDNASWGLLQANNAIYQASLEHAVKWVQQYFVQDADATKNLLQQLSDLQKINIQPADVTLTHTLQLLDGIHQ